MSDIDKLSNCIIGIFCSDILGITGGIKGNIFFDSRLIYFTIIMF